MFVKSEDQLPKQYLSLFLIHVIFIEKYGRELVVPIAIEVISLMS